MLPILPVRARDSTQNPHTAQLILVGSLAALVAAAFQLYLLIRH